MIERSRDVEQSQFLSVNTDQMASGEARVVSASVWKAGYAWARDRHHPHKDDKLLRPCDVASQTSLDETRE